MKYFVRVGGENQGPFSIDDLRARGVAPSEFVWRDGLADWLPAGGLPELAGVLRTAGGSAASAAVYTGDPSSPYASPKSIAYGDVPLPHLPIGPLRQSGFGIASTILGVGTFAAVFIALLIVGAIQQAGGANPNEPTPLMMVLSVSICFGGPLLHLAGLTLGIAGIFQHDRSKLFGIMGTCANGLVLLGFVVLLAIGGLLAMSAGH